MKKLFLSIFPLLVILIISVTASLKLFNPLFFTSHDGEGHVIRMLEFEKSFLDGQFPVRFAGRINHGLSYPYFEFNYPFIYYLALFIHVFSFSYVVIFKIILGLSVFLGGVGVYFFTRRFFEKLPALISSIFYIFVPYRLLDMYVRGAVAEGFALGLYPFLFYSIEKLIEKKKSGFYLFTFLCAILITSHNITAFFGIPLSFLYFSFRVLNRNEKKVYIKKIVFSFFLAVLLSSFFLIPVLFESSNTKLIELSEDYKMFFPSISEIIYSPWGFGAYVQGNSPGKMSPQVGIVPIITLILGVVILVTKLFLRKQKTESDTIFLFFVSFTGLLFFLLLPFSIFFWDHIFFLKLLQQPWRLVGYIIISVSISAGYIISQIKNYKASLLVSIILVSILMYSNRNHVRVNMYVPFHNPFEYAEVYGPSTTSKDEHMPRLAPHIYTDPNPDGDLIASTSGTTKRTIWKTNYHEFKLDLKTTSDFRDNTSYFPGWTAYIDGKETAILYSQDAFYRLRVAVPKGQHVVIFKFGETWYRILADILSLLTFCGILMYALWEKVIAKQNLRKLQKKSLAAKNAK